VKLARSGHRQAAFIVILQAAILPAWAGVARPKPLVVGPVDSSVRFTIPHTAPPLASTASDVGPLDPNQPMQRLMLILGPGPDQEHLLRTFLDSQQTKGSPAYHQWLTPEEFGAEFGPAPEDLQQVRTWLEQEGFSIDSVARSGRWIEFSGTAQQVESAFQTQMRHYQLAGEIHVSNASDISVPAALSPVIRGVLSLSNSFSRPLLAQHYQVHRNSSGALVPVDPNFTYNSGAGLVHYLAPADYSAIYNLGPIYQAGSTGAGQTIAIVGRSKVEVTDVETFRQVFNLPTNDPVMIVNGADPGVTFDEDAVEASLDVQWAGAIAPAATIDLVVSESTATTDGVDLSAAYIVDQNLAGIMSVSFGNCEQNIGPPENAFYNALWQQAAAEGISVFVSTGDDGAAGCDPQESFSPAQGGLAVSGLASTPFNTAVGGTQFNENGNDSTFWSATNSQGFGSAAGYIPEAVWNESCDPTIAGTICALFDEGYLLLAGSGGVSSIYGKPSWQTGSNVPNDNHRDLPDVSLAAAANHDGYLFCFEGECQTTTDSNGQLELLNASVVGGTSASSPSFAGIVALIDQITGHRQGLANYVLYPLAASENFANCNSSSQTNPSQRASGCPFIDITAGNNTVPGQTGYNAATGFDLATGLGSVDAAALATAWSTAAASFRGSTTSLSASVGGSPVTSISIQHGQAISVGIQVQPLAGSGVPTGNVSLLTDHYGAVGAGLLTNGGFSGSFNTLPGGSYNLLASYPGDSTFGGSQSSTIPVSIEAESSSITLSAGGSSQTASVPYGGFLQIQSTVAGASGHGVATGTVIFSDGGSQVTSIPLNNQAQAAFFTCGTDVCLTLGPHTLAASYSGDNSFSPSATVQPLTVNVTKGVPGFFLELIQTGANQGQQWLVDAFLEETGKILPTGTIQFFDGNSPLGSAQTVTVPSPGSAPGASVQVNLAPGTHSIGANYSGDALYNSASSIPFSITVGPPFQLSTTNAVATVTAGQSAAYNLSLTSTYGFSGNVAIACTGAPAGVTCSPSPSSVNLSSFATVPITVAVTTSASAKLAAPGQRWQFALATLLMAGTLLSLKRKPKGSLALLALFFVSFASSCGGGNSSSGGSSQSLPPGARSVGLVVTATSAGTSNSIALALQINP
jgi:Pro-kumamolisin, activation domain/Bacterial Ig-like domain (group 3)